MGLIQIGPLVLNRGPKTFFISILVHKKHNPPIPPPPPPYLCLLSFTDLYTPSQSTSYGKLDLSHPWKICPKLLFICPPKTNQEFNLYPPNGLTLFTVLRYETEGHILTLPNVNAPLPLSS